MRKKDISVYDFNEEEEAVEASSAKFMSKLVSRLNPTKLEAEGSDHALDKYTFLHAFTSSLEFKQTDMTGVFCIDLHERDHDHVSFARESPERNLTFMEDTSGMDDVVVSSTSYEDRNHMCREECEPGSLDRVDSAQVGDSSPVVPSISSNCFAEHPSKLVDVISDEEENWASVSTAPSTSGSDLAENESFPNHHFPDKFYSALDEMDNADMEVNVSSDYVTYGNMCHEESILTFFPDCIKVECSDGRSDEKVVLEWAITDVIRIDCQWSSSMEAALVTIVIRVSAGDGSEKFCDASEFMKVNFAFTDLNWLEKQRKIISLSERYESIWNDLPQEVLSWDTEVPEPNMWYSKEYFMEFMEPFEDVIYPKGDPDAVSISKRDIELLQPDTFINDTIIDFYIKYLKTKIQPFEKHRFHFFNSFFFRKLADLDKNPGCASEGRSAFLRVRKWTRKVNLFEKDYIFIPVNFNLHWSLLVICHPGAVTTFKDDHMEGSQKVPCILHMDSIKGSHGGLKDIVQSYLREEWREKHPESSEELSSKLANLRYVSLELPQQENSFDCGLFLLHYVELFLKEAPVDFSPFNISEHSSFLSADWFFPAEASLKRSFLRKLIYQLLKDASEKDTSVFYNNDHLYSELSETNLEHETVGFISKQCSPANMVLCTSVHSVADEGIESRLFPCDKGASVLLHEFIEPGIAAPSSLECQEDPFQVKSSLQKSEDNSTAEEHMQTSEHYAFPSREKDPCHALDGNLPICSTSYSLKDVEAYGTPWSCMEDRKESGESSVVPSDMDLLVSDQEDDEEVPRSVSPEKCGYVPDSSISEECPGSTSDDSQEIKTNNAESVDVEESPRINSNNPESGKCEILQGIISAKLEGGDGAETHEADRIKAADVEECQVVSTNKASISDDEDCLVVDTTTSEVRNCASRPLPSGENDPPFICCQDVEDSDDEDTVPTLKRNEELGIRLEHPPSKRQKLAQIVHRGCRRRTRGLRKR